MEKMYYAPSDIMRILERSDSYARRLISRLNKSMKEQYPNIMVIENRIPIWYWEEITKPMKGNEENETKY